MKRIFIISALFCLLFTTNSCHKGDDPLGIKHDDSYLQSIWSIKIDGVNHSFHSYQLTDQPDGYYSCSNDTSIQAFFATPLPPQLGDMYKCVSETKAVDHTIGAKEVAIEFNVGINDVYLSMDLADSFFLKHTDDVGYGQLTSLGEFKVVHFKNGTALDTTTASILQMWTKGKE